MKIKGNIYFLSLLKKISNIILGLVISICLNRSLGPSLRGDYGFYSSIVTTVSTILLLGLSNVYPNFVRNNKQWAKSTIVVMSIIQFVLIGLIATVLMTLYSLIIGMLVLWIGLAAFANQLLSIEIVDRYAVSAFSNIFGLVINCTILALAFVNVIPGSLVISFIAVIAKEAIIIIVCLLDILKHTQFSRFECVHIKELLRTGFLPMVTNVLIMINYRIDVIMLKPLGVASAEIGFYSVATSLAEYAWLIPDIFKEALISKTAKKDNIEEVNACLRLSFVVVVLCFIGFIGVGRIGIQVLFGEDYSPSYYLTIVVFGGIISMTYCKLLGVLYLAKGQWSFYFKVLLIAAVSNCLLNIPAILIGGGYGAAIVSVISYSVAGGAFVISYIDKYGICFRDIIIPRFSDFKLMIHGENTDDSKSH